MLFKFLYGNLPCFKWKYNKVDNWYGPIYISPRSSFSFVPTPEPVPPAALETMLKPHKRSILSTCLRTSHGCLLGNNFVLGVTVIASPIISVPPCRTTLTSSIPVSLPLKYFQFRALLLAKRTCYHFCLVSTVMALAVLFSSKNMLFWQPSLPCSRKRRGQFIVEN